MSTPESAKRLDLQDIAEVALVDMVEHVNMYLAMGWVIVAMVKNQYSEHGHSIAYHLGWPRSLGAPVQPDLRRKYEPSPSFEEAFKEDVDGKVKF